jgi:glycosyltransferase involved in cell wall biosynthesis
MKKKLLILSASQFGYLTDILKYCEFAREEFDITVVSWDYGRQRIEMSGVTVKYVPRNSSLLTRNLKLLKTFSDEIKRGYNVVFANYSRGISLVRLLNLRSNFMIDVRTLCVNSKSSTRMLYDFFLRTEIRFFKHISVISEGVGHKLNLKKFHLLPLGGERFTTAPKTFEKLSFLYVGTLNNRNIIECVKGFHEYLKTLASMESAPTFTVVGNSPNHELDEIKDYVATHNLSKNIIVVGAVPYNQLNSYFENANIGVSYVPLRSYFEYQPPTKTFEYLISGLPVIATNTYENKRIVKDNAGILIDDNVEAFKDSIHKTYQKKDTFDSESLIKTYAEFTWERIVHEKFIPMINQLA